MWRAGLVAQLKEELSVKQEVSARPAAAALRGRRQHSCSSVAALPVCVSTLLVQQFDFLYANLRASAEQQHVS